MLVSERITGKGAVQSLDLAVGVPLWEIEPFLAVIVVGLVYVGLRFPKEAKKLAEVWVQLTCLKQAEPAALLRLFFPRPALATALARASEGPQGWTAQDSLYRYTEPVQGGPERVRMYNENWRSFLQRFACLTLAGTIVAEVATGKVCAHPWTQRSAVGSARCPRLTMFQPLACLLSVA